MSNIARTEEFIYLQNKARHYDHLRKSKPAIKTFRQYNTISTNSNSPTQKLDILASSPYRHSMNTTHMQQYQEMKMNQSLVNGILSIRNSKRPEIYSHHNYSRYNNSIERNERNRRTSLKFHQSEKDNDIRNTNQVLGERLLKMKPSIGTMAEWNQRNETNKGLKKIASRYGHEGFSTKDKQQNDSSSLQFSRQKESKKQSISPNKKNKRVLSIYSNKNKYVPEHYRTFIEKDGSTVALRDRLFELPREIKQEYFKRQSSRKNMLKFDKSVRYIKDLENSFDLKTKLDLDYRPGKHSEQAQHK